MNDIPASSGAASVWTCRMYSCTGIRTRRPGTRKGTSMRRALEVTNSRAVRDPSDRHTAAPDIRKKIGIIHWRRRMTKGTARSERTLFFVTHGSGSKKCTA
jgi:hypothetical protein